MAERKEKVNIIDDMVSDTARTFYGKDDGGRGRSGKNLIK